MAWSSDSQAGHSFPYARSSRTFTNFRAAPPSGKTPDRSGSSGKSGLRAYQAKYSSLTVRRYCRIRRMSLGLEIALANRVSKLVGVATEMLLCGRWWFNPYAWHMSLRPLR